MFESIQLPPQRKRLMALVVSAVIHMCVIAALIAVPLIFYSSLPNMEVLTFLIQPPDPPPPPPPPAPPPAPAPQPRTIIAQYSVPTEIPKSIPPPDSDTTPVIDPKLVSSMNAGIPGGVPGGSPLGIIGGVLGKQLPLPPPPPPKAEPIPVAKKTVEPIFVGGDVQASKLIYKEPVTYPPLALRARITGVVLLRITVNEEGKVTDVKVLSGHPLLVKAAEDAVWHFKYSPTTLNGHPVPVIATVSINFSLQ